MKFLIDANCGRSFYKYINSKFIDATFANDIKLGLTDKEIISIANKEKRLIVTLDSDFGTLIYRDNFEYSGVLFLRLENQQLNEKIKVFDWILEKHGTELNNMSSCGFNPSVKQPL